MSRRPQRSSTAPTHPDQGRWREAVFFDLDDTLFDHTQTCETALQTVVSATRSLQTRSFPVVFAEYSRLLDVVSPEVLAGRTTHEKARDDRFQRLYEFCGAKVSVREARATSQEYRTLYQKLRAPVPGAAELLEAVSGRVTIGIISNNQHAEQVDKLRAIGLSRYINVLVTSEDAKVGKPDPAIFSMALDRAKVGPREAIMVGDSWPVDIEGALGCGMPAVWFNRWANVAPRRVAVPEFSTLDASPFLLEALLGPETAYGPERGSPANR